MDDEVVGAMGGVETALVALDSEEVAAKALATVERMGEADWEETAEEETDVAQSETEVVVGSARVKGAALQAALRAVASLGLVEASAEVEMVANLVAARMEAMSVAAELVAEG